MKRILFLIAIIPLHAQAGEYSDCILVNMKGVNVQSAANQVKIACREKALPYIPAKCYRTEEQAKMLLHIPNLSYDEYSKNSECIEKCLNASYWSKHFGDCKE